MSPRSSTSEPNALGFVGDAEARQAILDMFEKVRQVERNAAGPVLVMLVSRRLSCLYEMLLSSGDIDPFDREGFEVVTDRVLDASNDESRERWRGRRAVLVDDVINLGSSLTDQYDELVELVGNSDLVDVFVGIRDKNRSSPALMQHLGILPEGKGGPLERDEQKLKDLALDLVTCLYRSLTPYFTDFPAFGRFDVKPKALNSLLATRRWMVADVTAPIAADSQRALSFIPTQETEDLIRRKAVAQAVELADILKVRLYTKKRSGTDNVTVMVVPIGVPCGVLPKRLDRALSALTDELHNHGDSELRWEDWKPRAKHRLLQMYLSACLVAEFWCDLKDASPECPELDRTLLEESPTISYFGGQQHDEVTRAFDLAVKHYRENPGDGDIADERFKVQPTSDLLSQPEVRQHIAMLRVLLDTGGEDAGPERPEPGKVAKVGGHWLWVQRIHSVFGEVDLDLERPQAKLLRELSYADYVRYRKGEDIEGIGPRVLSQGIRLAELADALGLNVDGQDRWQRALPSLALDVANDLGIAVPATVGGNSKRPVYRQYRSGEGAFLAGKSHVRQNKDAQSDSLDYMTRYALGLPSVGEIVDEEDRERAELWERDMQARRHDEFLGGRLAQIWAGEVVDHDPETFTADFTSTLTDGDSVQMTFRINDVLDKEQAKGLKEGAPVEWRVYEIKHSSGITRARKVTVVPSAR